MNLTFYMDHQVRSAVTTGLRQRGIDVLTAHEDDAADADDERILSRATKLGRIVYTNDDDFLEIAARWLREGRPFSGVAYAHQQSVTDSQAIESLDLIAKAVDADYMRSRVEYLPL